MYTVLKKVTTIVFSIAILVFAFNSCSDDIILEPLDTLLGRYDGHYTLTDLSQGGSGRTLIDLDVSWEFRDISYSLDDTTQTICTPSGEYVLTGDQISLAEGFDGNSGGVCDPSQNPTGQFSLLRPSDSLILRQSINDIFIEIRLKKVK